MSLSLQDIEKERSIRRYLALRSCAPNPRKGAQPAPETPDDPPRVILRPKKDVVGFVISEWDVSRALWDLVDAARLMTVHRCLLVVSGSLWSSLG